MRALVALLIAAVVATGCAVDVPEVIGLEPNRPATLEEIADPANDLELDDVSRLDLGDSAPNTDTFCDAFGATKLLWIEGALVPLQFLIDAWQRVDDAPDAVADDVDAMRELADRRLEWQFGRIDANDRPDIDLAMAEGLERIADHAAENCELPLVAGPDARGDVVPEWTDDERSLFCEQSKADITEGITLYQELRGREALHGQQIELATRVEFLRASDLDDALFWRAPDWHGIGSGGDVVALQPCS